MMSRPAVALALVTLAALGSVAAADVYDATQPVTPPRAYISAGALGSVDTLFRAGVYLDGGLRLSDSRLFVRGQLGGGRASVWGDTGRYLQARAGIEGRHCIGTSAGLCGFAGADLAVTRDSVITADVMSGTATSIGVVPRVGAELGEELRVRGALEVPMTGEVVERGATTVGLALTVAAVVAF